MLCQQETIEQFISVEPSMGSEEHLELFWVDVVRKLWGQNHRQTIGSLFQHRLRLVRLRLVEQACEVLSLFFPGSVQPMIK